uniref:NADH-ubiquinone oxidoreductase chain 4 n=1 Tax=Galathealinum brachiosum TaxID=53701 RepID=A0A0E3DRA6_9ANNE|nr:NADH dehydrogenase subunit 4 [Galathealinum brachiosum]AIL54805.1 NADH dehydrogenase subunit 4 [Galathealinum brachiosum]
MLKLMFLLFSLFYFIYYIPKTYSWFLTMNYMFLLTPISIFFLINPYFLNFSINLYFSINSISFILIMLSLWITPLMILSSSSILLMKSYKNFLFIVNMMLIILILSFLTNNLFLFYIFFESSLIPIFSMIMIWGYQPERLQASLYLMMYTISSSLPLLMMIFFLFKMNYHLNMNMYNWIFFDNSLSFFWWLLMMLAFLVKLPMFLFHLWLPKAHVEAPVAGSMILASVLLKLGSYGVIRISELYPYMNKPISFILIPLSLIGSSLISIMCIRQSDLKSLIAYSSVSHMAILLSGMLSNNSWGTLGMLILMIAHGLCSSTLFMMTNIIYSSIYTRSIYLIKGLMIMFPMFTFWWFIMNMINMSAPPSMNFLSEIMLFTSIIKISINFLWPLIVTSFFTTMYSLYIYSSSQHGNFLSFQNNLISMNSSSFLSIYLHFFPMMIILFKLNIFF